MRRILLVLAAAFLLAACNQGGGDQEQGTAPAEGAPNDADVTFTQNMIPTTGRPSRWPSWSTATPTGRSYTSSPTAS